MDRPSTFRQADVVSNADSIARISCADALNQREQSFSLFTPALLITHGGFDRDPVVEFGARFPADQTDQRPFLVQLQRDSERFFTGLGACRIGGRGPVINWDQRLYCIAADRAEECFAFIGGIAFSEPKTGFFASVFSYDMSIPDPTSARGQFLQVKIFGVAANSFVGIIEQNGIQTPRALKIPMTSAAQTAAFVKDNSLLTTFTGEDPLSMRD